MTTEKKTPGSGLAAEDLMVLEAAKERIEQRRELNATIYWRPPVEVKLRSIGELLGAALLNFKAAPTLQSTWLRVAGEPPAKHSRPLRWENSETTLIVWCDSAQWREVLATDASEIAGKLSAELGREVSLQFETDDVATQRHRRSFTRTNDQPITCSACGLEIIGGGRLVWSGGEKRALHVGCAGEPRTMRLADAVLERLGRTKDAAQRTALLHRTFAKMKPGAERDRLTLEAGRIEAEAVLDTVAKLKTPSARRRHLETGLATLRGLEPLKQFELAEMQKEFIQRLETALRELSSAE